MLGLRLIETGETQKGRKLVLAGKSFSTAKAWTGLGLSMLPIKLRGKAFELVRSVRG